MENYPDDNTDIESLLTPEEQDKLLEEASKTVSGLKRDVDPREVDFISEENERLRKIAEELSPPQND